MNKNIIYVVDDNGHSHHKLAAMVDGKIQTWKLPAVVGDGSAGITNVAGDLQDTYDIDGRLFCCNEQIQHRFDIRNESYQHSAENKALVAHSLVNAGLDGKPIALGVTLPWRSAFVKGGSPNKAMLEKVGNFYSSGKIKNMGNGQEIKIVKAKPYAEGLAAFYDWGIGDNGELDRATSTTGPICVIDIGGSTSDIVTLLGGSRLSVDHSRCDTKKIGVLDAKQQMTAKLSHKLRDAGVDGVDADGGIPGWMIEQAFTAGRVAVGALGEIDMTEELAVIKASVANQITAFIKTTIGNPLSYQVIIFVGGGSIVFGEQLKALFPHAVFLDEFANARGALKYMLRVDRQFQEAVIDG